MRCNARFSLVSAIWFNCAQLRLVQGIGVMQLQAASQQLPADQRRSLLINVILRKLVMLFAVLKTKQSWHASDITHRGL
jgi:hypothetical protein